MASQGISPGDSDQARRGKFFGVILTRSLIESISLGIEGTVKFSHRPSCATCSRKLHSGGKLSFTNHLAAIDKSSITLGIDAA